MASLGFCSTSIAKQHVSEKRTGWNCQHYPSIICHKEKPIQVLVQALMRESKIISHNEERVEHLYGIENSPDRSVLPVITSPASSFECA